MWGEVSAGGWVRCVRAWVQSDVRAWVWGEECAVCGVRYVRGVG